MADKTKTVEAAEATDAGLSKNWPLRREAGDLFYDLGETQVRMAFIRSELQAAADDRESPLFKWELLSDRVAQFGSELCRMSRQCRQAARDLNAAIGEEKHPPAAPPPTEP